MPLKSDTWRLCAALVVTWCIAAVVAGKTSFRAAVYEHAPFLPGDRKLPVSRAQALGNLQPNLEILETQAMAASRQGADIFVFPENGLCGYGFSREALASYAEVIPDPREGVWSACDSPARVPDIEVVTFLSCLAKNASLYLVANFEDKQPCDPLYDPDCPQDSFYLYNTDLVFDPEGLLLTKYHKENLFLFEKKIFNEPKELGISTFTTPFGKFGVFTCFDILFHDPAILLVEKYNVTNVVFPTAWMDALPLLAAVQFHSAFAMGTKVNFLAANIHLPELRFHGSGIYTPSGAKAFWYNTTTLQGRLLLADIDVIPEREPLISKTEEEVVQQVANMRSRDATRFTSEVFRDEFNFASLEGLSGEVTVCQKLVCCHLEFNRSTSGQGELYAFGAFDGLHTYEGRYYLQVCVLLKCANSSHSSCGAPTKEATTVFSRLRITGTFQAKYVFPEVLLSDHGSLTLAPGEFHFRDGELRSEAGFSHPLLSASLLGRVYEWDDVLRDHGPGDDAVPDAHASWVVVIFAALVLRFLAMVQI